MPERPHSSLRFRLLIGVVLPALTVVTVAVFLKGASDEPYFRFTASDALVQVGLAAQLMLLWLQLGMWLTVRVVQRRIGLVWMVAVAWASICELYLSGCPFGYVEDIERFASPSFRAGP